MAGRVLISAEGRAYRDAVARVARAQAIVSASGELAVDVALVPGDRRKRDIDNPLKALLDALTHAGAWEDDSQIRRLVVSRHDPVPGAAAAIVEIRPWNEDK
jgi:Holliday junction resolvase RusA-like endonuclease